MVRFSLSSAGWLCTIGLLTTAIPVLALPESPIAQSTQPASATVEQLLAIGKQQVERKDFEGAIGTYRKALAIAESAHNLSQQLEALRSIGNAYREEGVNILKKKDYPRAVRLSEQSLEPLQRGLEVARQIPDRRYETLTLSDIGSSYWFQSLALGEADQEPAKRLALDQRFLSYAQQGLEIAKEIKDARLTERLLRQIFSAHTQISLDLSDLKNYSAALAEISLMDAIAKEINSADLQKKVIVREYEIYLLLSNFYDNPEHYDKLLEVDQKIIALGAQLNEPESGLLLYQLSIGRIYRFRGQYAEAIKVYEYVLTRARAIPASQHVFQPEVSALFQISNIYTNQGRYPEALVGYEKISQLLRSQRFGFGDSSTYQASILNNTAGVYRSQGKYAQALSMTQQALDIQQKLYEQYMKGVIPENIRAECALGPKSSLREEICTHPENIIPGLDFNLLKSEIALRAKSSRLSMGTYYGNIALIYSNQGDYTKSAEFNKKSLEIARELKDSKDEATSLNNTGSSYVELGDYDKGNRLLQQSLKIIIDQGDRPGEVFARLNLGKSASEQGDYPAAIKEYQQALILSQKLEMRSQTAILLSLTGNINQSQGNYATALENYNKALNIQEAIGEPAQKIGTQLRLGNLKRQLGDRPAALTIHQEALALAQKIGAKQLEAKAILAIATDYREQGNLDDALKGYNQALEIATSIDDLNAKPQALYGIGQLYAQQNQPDKALTYLNQALAIQQRTGVKPRQAETLNAIGQVQTQLGKYAEAQTTLQQAYALAQTVGDRATEAIAIANLGQLFNKLKQPETAIVFYKQSVNTYESIRAKLRPLSQEQQKSYAETISGTYRALADLLIAQGRLGEAQQILELLKIQELNDFSKITRSTIPSTPIELSPIEKSILAQYGDLITFTQKVAICQDQQCPELDKLLVDRDQFNKGFILRMQGIEQQADADRQAGIKQRNDDFTEGAANIVAKPHTLLVYPLVLKDRVRILWTATGKVYGDTTCPIGEAQLWDATKTFHDELRRPTSLDAAKAKSKVLYDCLIAPLEGVIKANQIQHIVFAPDLATNYIPLSALYDGQQFLIQRFTIANIVDARSTDTQATLPTNPQVLALGMSIGKGDFSPLPNVPPELASIVKTTAPKSPGLFPGTALLNADFTQIRLAKNLRSGDIKILHFATHADFKPNNPIGSFLLLGDGQELTIPDIQNLDGLSAVHLVTLSACQTALTDAKGGVEVRAISSYFKQAKTVVASLWSVNDASTALIMQQFYAHLATGKTKATALQQVQQDFINGKLTPTNASKVGRSPAVATIFPENLQLANSSPPKNFIHPHYWAPFILIGNSR